MTAVSYSFLDRTNDGVEYGLDMRHTAYTVEGRQPRPVLDEYRPDGEEERRLLRIAGPRFPEQRSVFVAHRNRVPR